MEEKEVFEFEITTNVVANFIDDEDKFIKHQIIDHIIQNGKYYDVINISKSRVKELVENGIKYEQLKKENAYLKSAQNKIAIEKLKDVKYIIFDTPLDKKFYNYNPEKKSGAIFEEINTKLDTMLAELKGGK